MGNSRPAFVMGSTPFFPHQAENWEPLREKPEHALFWATASGKTYFDLMCSVWSYCAEKIDAVLVIAPNGVHKDTWVGQQIPRHVRIPYTAMFYESKSSCTADQWRELNDLPNRPGLLILTMYFEALASKSGYEFARAFCQRFKGRIKITVDESHRLRTAGSLASTRLAALRDLSVQRRIMTATPTGNGLEDLYGQFRFLGPHILDVSTKAEYIGMYVNQVKLEGTDFYKIIGYKNVRYLNKRLAPYVSVAKKPAGLPPQFWVDAHTVMSAEQDKAYWELVYDYQTELRNGRWVEADLSIVRMKRLQQIVAGHITVPDPDNPRRVREILELACPRVEDTLDRVKGAPGKSIIWAEEHFEIERLGRAAKAAGIEYELLYGKVKRGDARTDAMARFTDDPLCTLLIANGATGGEGYQVVGGATPDVAVGDSIFYSHTWSRITRTQCEGRPHRPGTAAERCVYQDILCKGTIDDRIRRRVKYKDDVATMVEDPAGVAALLDPDLDYEEGDPQAALTFT